MPLKVVPRRDRKLHRLVKKGETRSYARGEPLYAQGDSCDLLILVRTGHLRFTHRFTRRLTHRLTHLEEDQDERVIAVAGPWELSGEEALFHGQGRKSGAHAGEPSVVTFLDGEGVNRALRTASKTYGAFLLAKEEELALARALGGPRRPGGAARQLGALLLHLARRLGRTEEGKGTRIPIRLSHSVLADLSGSHRSTVTTQLNEWMYEGVIQQNDGQLLILKADALGS